jgi:hypothetical protein
MVFGEIVFLFFHRVGFSSFRLQITGIISWLRSCSDDVRVGTADYERATAFAFGA